MQLRSDELKVKALKNFSFTLGNKEWIALELFLYTMEQNRLGPHERRFLDHLLKKYKINYLDWAFLTPWVKDQITASTLKHKKNVTQMYFEFAHDMVQEINERRHHSRHLLSGFNFEQFSIPWPLQNSIEGKSAYGNVTK